MTIHLCRDYVSQFTTNYQGDIAQWVLAIFLKDVLGYTVVGSTGFGTNFTPIATATASPNLAGINYGPTGGSGGGTAYFEVGVPSGVYTVSAADIQRVLVLKSTVNPTFNSGVFSITGVDTVNNRFIVDYRTADPGSVSFPPPEAGGTTGMAWWLYDKDSSVPATRGTNSSTGYKGYGTSTDSRIILQSPHASAWQVRLCSENSTDYGGIGSGPCNSNTWAPGFGGNGAGDFPTGTNGGKHLHVPLFWDMLNNNQGADNTRAWAVGPVGGGSGNLQCRYMIVGDDTGQAFALFIRRAGAGTMNPCWAICGIPDNEPPLPSDNTRRLFLFGFMNTANLGQNVTIAFGNGRADGGYLSGYSFGSRGVPISCSMGMWAYIEGNVQNASPIFHANAGDNPFLGSTELTTMDLWGGVQQHWAVTFTYTFPLEPRFMGTLPLMRAGRTNFPTFSTTTDAGRAWYHFQNGVFMTYNGPNPVP